MDPSLPSVPLEKHLRPIAPLSLREARKRKGRRIEKSKRDEGEKSALIQNRKWISIPWTSPASQRGRKKIKCIARPVHVSITFLGPPPHPQTRGPFPLPVIRAHPWCALPSADPYSPRQPIALNGTRGVVVESCFLNSIVTPRKAVGAPDSPCTFRDRNRASRVPMNF